MAKRAEPIARIRLARSVPRLLVLPALFVIAGGALAAYGVLMHVLPMAALVAAVGGGLALVGLAWAVWVLSVRLDVEEAAVRVHWVGGERRYPLVAGPVTRVRFRGENASRLRARTGILGWQLGAATLRDEEEIHVVRLAPTPSAILVPTEQGRLAIAAATEADLLDALTRAARERQRLQEEEAATLAAEAASASSEATDVAEPEPPPLTGIERALLEERMAAERAEAERAVAVSPPPPSEAATVAEPAPTPPVEAPERRRRIGRPAVARIRVRRPRPSSILVVLPLVGAGLAWGIGLATGRMPPPGTDIARLTALGLVLAGPATSVGAIMALAWWPRLVGVVVAGGLAASVLVGRVLLG
ncbi:MAG TPA: hypothetical protein VFN76_10225 [Candidatus Limnocylindria bacterium]|nr:hypothetical protein [Candidatus Limnocylindria bacterium]